ncbi:hypothetical protein [[Eubacterium] cellulosolvens]
MKILIQNFGKIPEDEKLEIHSIMKEFYQRLKFHELEIVDLIIFENSSLMEVYSRLQQDSIGVYSIGSETGFIASHEAWTGIPRILVCFERLKKFELIIKQAILRHEAAHSVLHGSLEYYIFQIPRSLSKTAEIFNLPREFVIELLYLISIAVKDYEVTKLLIGNDYVDDQIAYSSYFIKPGKDDLRAWKMSEGDFRKELLCLLSRLKDLTCFIAAHENKKIGYSIIEKNLDYFPSMQSTTIYSIAQSLTKMHDHDTFTKVELVTDLIVERLVEKIFGSE